MEVQGDEKIGGQQVLFHQKLTLKEGGLLYKMRELPTDYQPGYRFFERMGLAISVVLFIYLIFFLIMKPISKH